MLTKEEEKFLNHWEKNREAEKSSKKLFSVGLGIGLLIGIGIVINYLSGWYTRATMVANSQSTPLVLIIAVIIIALFCSFFYNQHKWEMNEQHFHELKHKKDSENKGNAKQQEL